VSNEELTGMPPGDPPPATSWGFSGHLLNLIRTREQAEATVRFFAVIRKTIVTSPAMGGSTTDPQPRVTSYDAQRWASSELDGDERVEVITRALRVIALDPVGRADTLLALDAHTAYLCGSFGVPEPA
jgi:hypothetical protein